MKTQHIIPLLFLVGCCAVSAQTTNAPTNTKAQAQKKTVSYTLRNLQTEKTIANPTDADIRAMVASLKHDVGPVLALEDDQNQALQMDEVSIGRYGFSCVGGGTDYFVKDGHECSAEVAIKIIISFRDGTADWKTLAEWRH